jgi:hypothetical protein
VSIAMSLLLMMLLMVLLLLLLLLLPFFDDGEQDFQVSVDFIVMARWSVLVLQMYSNNVPLLFVLISISILH